MDKQQIRSESVIRIKPFHYIHVLDNNSNTTRVEIGPKTFTRQEHEKVLLGPDAMINIPPRHFAIIANPVERDEKGEIVFDSHGQIKLRHGDQEIRFSDKHSEPFPLFPGESLAGNVRQLQLVPPNTALRLRAARDVLVSEGELRKAGEEWVFRGPGTYVPKVEVTVLETIQATIIKPNQALKLRARALMRDCYGKERRAGEEWLVREAGAYVQDADEDIVETVNSFTLTERNGLHVSATRTFTDVFGKQRKAGEKWLVTLEDTETFLPDVYEVVIQEVQAITLSTLQYCVVLDPVDLKTGKQNLGRRDLRKGEQTFFLRPGERLEKGVQAVHVLGNDEALLLRATEEYVETLGDNGPVTRKPGDRWMIRGPLDFVPPVEVEIVEKRAAIALDENEGVYVRDLVTGTVRAVIRETYMLKANEELWEKDVPKAVEDLLAKDLDPLADRQAYMAEGSGRGENKSSKKLRDRTRVITYRAPHNSAVQIYDYREKRARVVFGPDLVMLKPDEQFTVLSLSGDKPKRPNVIKSIGLLLGPDFMTDIITVETSDHARLQLQLSYNWFFDVNKELASDAQAIFQVPDFVGDACKAIASRVRGSVAAVAFDNFHRNSAKIIRSSVFGVDETGKIKNHFVFPQNKLVITNIDIQSVEPVDQKTRDSLQKSVQLAIEITTKSQEAAARHEAERIEQEARGRLERQKINDEAEAEKSRSNLLLLQAESSAVESTGQAKAEAKARAEAQHIEAAAAVEQARLRAESAKIEQDNTLAAMISRQNAELDYTRKQNELEIQRLRELSNIEASKFKSLVDAIGADTIKAISMSGPELQCKLLSSLNLQGYLITDGSSPVNLFQTAQGLIGGPQGTTGGFFGGAPNNN